MEDLVVLEHVSKSYPIGGTRQFVLRDVSLRIGRGETLGIVGESGSGKSTLARIVMGIERPDSGKALYAGKPVSARRYGKNLANARKSQIIFQDSLASLDPRMTVEAIIAEGMEIHSLFDRTGRGQRVLELLALVGLELEHTARYPRELSGGQRQRVGIARALAVDPEFIVCDEPISALDVSVQSYIMNLLQTLKAQFGLTYLFIAHDLNMVNYISDRIAVIYLGRIVELGESGAVCLHPRHPYTKILLDAVLIPDPNRKSLDKLPTRDVEPATTDSAAPGCAFACFCPEATELCVRELPPLRETSAEHFCACHFALPHEL